MDESNWWDLGDGMRARLVDEVGGTSVVRVQWEEQAHAMSHPAAMESGGRQHVSDAAAEAMKYSEEVGEMEEELFSAAGVVLLTVAEHDELVRKAGMSRMEFKLARDWMRAASERDALRAEVEKLKREDERKQLENELMADVIREQDQILERLRKGRDETVNNSGFGNSCAVGGALSVAGNQLDPRLGLPQPEGEPCEPMSAKSWRWLP